MCSLTQKQDPVLTAISDSYLFNLGCCSLLRDSQGHKQGATLMSPVSKGLTDCGSVS